jgi:NAD(P)-dependent dehydrogenase (short-subunit alcohol dehydrogenase family)
MMKTFLVTGAAGGLGRAVVAAALQAGHRVVATDLDPGSLPVPHEQRARMRVLPLDVTSPAAAREAVRDAVDTFGGVDVLVNSAGYRSAGSIEVFRMRSSGGLSRSTSSAPSTRRVPSFP